MNFQHVQAADGLLQDITAVKPVNTIINGPTKFDMQNLRNGDNSDLKLFTLKNKTKQEQQ